MKCPFCGWHEDRVVGSLDLEHALKAGQTRFEPGILGRVHRGILYVDEVNLLRILNYPKRNIGTGSADKLIRFSAESELPLWNVLQQAEQVPELNSRTLEAITNFVGLLEKGEIEYALLGRHRRVKAEDLFEYKNTLLCATSLGISEIKNFT